MDKLLAELHEICESEAQFFAAFIIKKYLISKRWDGPFYSVGLSATFCGAV